MVAKRKNKNYVYRILFVSIDEKAILADKGFVHLICAVQVGISQ